MPLTKLVSQPFCRMQYQYVDGQKVRLQRGRLLEIQSSVGQAVRRTQFDRDQKSVGKNAEEHLLCREKRRADDVQSYAESDRFRYRTFIQHIKF